MKRPLWVCLGLGALLALSGACAAPPSGLTVNVEQGSDVARPTSLSVTWFSDRGSIFQREDVPVREGPPLATFVIWLDLADSSDRRILVRGAGPGTSSSLGAVRIRGAAVNQVVTITLQAAMPDSDGDGIPDVIDDCAPDPCGAADAGAPDDAAPDASSPEDGLPPGEDDVGAAVAPDSAAADVGVPGPPQFSGLVALWLMDDGQGTRVGDSSPTSNPGTIMRPTPGNWAPGRHGAAGGTALSLAGTSWVSVPSSPRYDALAGLTLAAWVFWPQVTTADQVLLARQRGSGLQNAFWLGVDRGRLHFSVEDQGVAVTIPAGRWIHLAAIYDGARVIVYLDGGEIGRQAITANVTRGAGAVSIGADINTANATAGSQMFVGLLDEVAIYNRPLTPAEVARLAE